MKTPQHPTSRRRGFTLIELLVVISIIAILAALAVPGFAAILMRARMGNQMSDGRQIYLAMRNYAQETSHGGKFPMYKDPDDANTLIQNSNEAFEILLPRYLDDKKVFDNPTSAWHRLQAKTEATKHKVQPGECDWVYVRGLSDTSNSRYPLLANAFAPGSTTYVSDPGQKGGVWKGYKAVVVWAGGSAEIVETKDQGESFYIKRADKPSANAFEKDADWLSGEDVQVLYPQG